MSTAALSKPEERGVFAQRDFRTLWLAQFVSVFGDFLALFGVISLITFRWHGTAAQVTYLLIAYMLPLAIVSPISGVFVDRWRVKQVMISSDLIRGALVLLLPWVRDLAQLCAIFIALSIVSSFFSPAQSVALRTLVAKEKLLAANALMSQAFYTVRLLSPVVAGALVAWLTEKSCFYLDAFSFFFSAAMIGSLLIKRDTAPGSNTVKGFLDQLTGGNRFIFTHPALAFVITSMVSAMFVMSCLSPLFSIYVRDILHSGVFLYGVVSSAVGVGLIVGTMTVNRFGRQRSKKSIVLAGLTVCAAGVTLLGIFRAIPAAVATTFTMGFGISFVVVAAQTLMQQETPPAMLGRVSSSFMSVFSLAQVLGLLLSGHLAVWFGIRVVFLLCAAGLALIVIAGLTQHKPPEISQDTLN
jgi:MFS transporter, DHA3 family, macrolide efflux protein